MPNELGTPVLECLQMLFEKVLASCLVLIDSRPNNARIPHGLLRLISVPRVEVDTLSRVIVVDPYDVDIGSGSGTQPDACEMRNSDETST